jgi:hypothetical protein
MLLLSRPGSAGVTSMAEDVPYKMIELIFMNILRLNLDKFKRK